MTTCFWNPLNHVFGSVIPSSLADTVCVHQQLRERIELHPHPLFTFQEAKENKMQSLKERGSHRAGFHRKNYVRSKLLNSAFPSLISGKQEETKAGKPHFLVLQLLVKFMCSYFM